MSAPTVNVPNDETKHIEMCEIEATVATGFEQTAKEELEEKFNTTARAARGKIIANIPIKDVKRVLELGCVDNVRVLMTTWKNASLPKDQLECMGYLRTLVPGVNWEKGLAVWKEVYTFNHPISSSPLENYVFTEPILTSRQNQHKKQSKNKKSKNDKFGKKGDKFGGKGDKSDGKGDKSGGKGDKLGGKGDKSGGKQDKHGRKGDKFGGRGDKDSGKNTSDQKDGSSINILKRSDHDDKNVPHESGSGDSAPPLLEFVSDNGRHVHGANDAAVEHQFSDAETESESKTSLSGSRDVAASLPATQPRTESEHNQANLDVNNIDSVQIQTSASSCSVKNELILPLEACSIDNFALLSPCSEYRLNVREQLSEGSLCDVATTADVLSSPVQMSPQNTATVRADESTESELQPPPNRKSTIPFDPLKPAFRVTCNRAGDSHSFDSMCAASNFGGAIQEYFGWNVDMKNFHIEVVLHIDGSEVTVGLGLTRESLHKRNITVFGATTLRPTIAYNMLRMCKIQPGEIVCDPMCGSGSIPIQAARGWPEAYHLAGDNYAMAVERTNENVVALNKELSSENRSEIGVDLAYWDVTNLPLKDSSIDVFITDLPFGKRMGSRFSNQKLYPDTLLEVARVCRPGTGRVCLLTQDKNCIIKAIQSLGRYWQRRMTLGVNLGGLAAGVYLLTRTYAPIATLAVPSRSQTNTRDSGCQDFRANMSSDPRGFQVIRHTFNSSSTSSEKSEVAKECAKPGEPAVNVQSASDAVESSAANQHDDKTTK